jgi:hypothetical protein
MSELHNEFLREVARWSAEELETLIESCVECLRRETEPGNRMHLCDMIGEAADKLRERAYQMPGAPAGVVMEIDKDGVLEDLASIRRRLGLAVRAS